MNRLEIIHLRLAGATPSGLVADIQRAIAEGGAGTTARIYRHATLTGDLSIHLHLGQGGRRSRTGVNSGAGGPAPGLAAVPHRG